MVLYIFFSQHLYFKPHGLLTRFSYNTCSTLQQADAPHAWPQCLSLALKRCLTVSALLLRPHSLNSFLKWLKRVSVTWILYSFWRSVEVSASEVLLWGKRILFYLRFCWGSRPSCLLWPDGRDIMRTSLTVSREGERWSPVFPGSFPPSVSALLIRMWRWGSSM